MVRYDLAIYVLTQNDALLGKARRIAESVSQQSGPSMTRNADGTTTMRVSGDMDQFRQMLPRMKSQ